MVVYSDCEVGKQETMKPVVDLIKEKTNEELLALIETLTDDIPTLQPDEFGDTFMIEMCKETLRKARAEAKSRGLTFGAEAASAE